MSFFQLKELKRATNGTISLIKSFAQMLLVYRLHSKLHFLRNALFEICIPDGYSYAFQIANAKGKRKKTGYKIWVDKWWNGVDGGK